MEVTEADAGDYRCTAKNHLGSVHHTIQVTVKSEMDNSLDHFTTHLPLYISSYWFLNAMQDFIIWGTDVLSVNNIDY